MSILNSIARFTVPLFSNHIHKGVLPPHIVQKADEYYADKLVRGEDEALLEKDFVAERVQDDEGNERLVLKTKDRIIYDPYMSKRFKSIFRDHGFSFKELLFGRKQFGNVGGPRYDGKIDGRIEVYQHNGVPEEFGPQAIFEGDPHVDHKQDVAWADSKRAYELTQKFRQFLKEILNLNSLDNNGIPLRQILHFNIKGSPMANAFFHPEVMSMFYGSGDGFIFRDFLTPDILGHEHFHGVLEFMNPLVYMYEPGALQEGLSDVAAISFKHWLENKPVDDNPDNWVIGDETISGKNPDGSKMGMRNMLTGLGFYDHMILGDDPSVIHMKDYKWLPPEDDNGGVHIYSGIVNRAFAVMCISLAEYTGEEVYSYKQPIDIFKAAIPKVSKYASFAQYAKATLDVAQEKYGKDSFEYKAVEKGWQDVGVEPSGKGWIYKGVMGFFKRKMPIKRFFNQTNLSET